MSPDEIAAWSPAQAGQYRDEGARLMDASLRKRMHGKEWNQLAVNNGKTVAKGMGRAVYCADCGLEL